MILARLVLLLAAAVGEEPEQIHLAVGADPGDITFTWSFTARPNNPLVAIAQGPIVKARAKLLQGEENLSYICKAEVRGLTPGQQYYYRVGDASLGVSKIHSFTVPPQSGATHYILLGDLSIASQPGQTTWRAVNEYVETQPVEAVFHAGDLAYDLCTEDNRKGDQFMRDIQSLAASVPYMAVAGNHEYTDKFKNYIMRFNYDANTQNFYYTFTSGYARFVVFTSEFWFKEYPHLLSSELLWLSSVLSRSAQDITAHPWLIVLTHRPLYCVDVTEDFSDCGSSAETLRNAVEELLHRSGVDLFVNGHVHNYQRTAPIYRGGIIASGSDGVYINPGAPVYLTVGGAGNEKGNVGLGPEYLPPWLEAASSAFSFGSLHIHNATHLQYQQLDSSTLSPVDQFWLVKDYN